MARKRPTINVRLFRRYEALALPEVTQTMNLALKHFIIVARLGAGDVLVDRTPRAVLQDDVCGVGFLAVRWIAGVGFLAVRWVCVFISMFPFL